MTLRQMQIGEVAQQTGLSLRTIRYYEEMTLVQPSARSTGGFRLYTETDVARLRLVRGMKPLGFSLEEMGDLLHVMDSLEQPGLSAQHRARQVDLLEQYYALAQERVGAARRQIEVAEEFADDLRTELRRQRTMTDHD